MKIIVGLGNIGKLYENTPHNAGFLFIEMLRDFLSYDNTYTVSDWKIETNFDAMIAKVRVGMDIRALLVKPTTLMNASGRAVYKISKKHEDFLARRDLIVIHDDLDLSLGSYKMQKGVGPKGHNGIKHIEQMIGSTEFLRVRIGVDNRDSTSKVPGQEYVLSKMKEIEQLSLKESCSEAIRSFRSVIEL